MNEKYADMLEMEHPASKKHPRMSIHDRAAQFAPFAALTGHSEAIDETAKEHFDEVIRQNTNEVFYD